MLSLISPLLKGKVISESISLYPIVYRVTYSFYISKHKVQVILSKQVSDSESLKYPKWVESMEKEYKALVANHTWLLVAPLEGTKIIGNKWVLCMKLEADKSLSHICH